MKNPIFIHKLIISIPLIIACNFLFAKNGVPVDNCSFTYNRYLNSFQSESTNNNQSWQNIKLKNLDNKTVTLSEKTKTNKVVVISFWATWCKPCMEELNAINEKLDSWKKDADFIFIAISTDDVRTGSKVKSLVNGKGWNFMVLKDMNQELKRFFNVTNIPSSLIIDNKGEIKFRHSGYSPGNEDDLFNEILKLNE